MTNKIILNETTINEIDFEYLMAFAVFFCRKFFKTKQIKYTNEGWSLFEKAIDRLSTEEARLFFVKAYDSILSKDRDLRSQMLNFVFDYASKENEDTAIKYLTNYNFHLLQHLEK